MKKTGDTLFLTVTLCFSALLLVLSLLCGVRMARLNDRAAACRREAAELQTENERLRARCACSLSLEEIERYAVEKLGMQRLRGEQIIVVEEPVR